MATKEPLEAIYADFTPPSAPRRHSNSLFTTNPLVSSILQRSFPLIIIANTCLEFLTWSSRDPVLNAFYWVSAYLIIYYYSQLYYFAVVPVIVMAIYFSINYYINSIYIDVYKEKPTLDEILDSLENFCTRMDILIAPLKTIHISYKKLINFMFVLTPFHILSLKYLIRPQNYVLIWTIIFTTYHSLWFQATMKILWRSHMIRTVCNFLIGVQPSSSFYNNYKILTVSQLPGNKKGKIIQFQILENQRRWLGLGWSNKLLPYERANYTNEALQDCSSPENFTFPFNSKHWKWLEEEWHVDLDHCKNKNKEGWVYYDNYWQSPQFLDSIVSYTRSRKWTRKAVLVAEKTAK